MVTPYDTITKTSQSQRDSLSTKCCCCIPLRLGCFILGYLSLVFHTCHTLALLTFTIYIGITTHGFDHFDPDRHRFVSDLTQAAILLIVVLCANIAWLIINIACLVGLHKKKLIPIRVYIGFATVKLVTGFVYFVMAASEDIQSIIIHSLGLGLVAYYILVYYIYAIHLERELEEPRPELPAGDIAIIYPVKIDKEKLVV